MTNTFKRRIYRYCVASAISFLGAFLLYDLGDIGIATDRLLFPCWDNDTSEDTNVRRNRSNAYPITFYTEAALVTSTVVFLLVFTMIRNRPTIAEGSVLAFALFVAGVCTFIGRLSSRLE